MRNFIRILYREWSFFAALALFLLAVLCIEWPVLHLTHGLVVYPVDTTYLQLATAKNLAFNHSWNLNIGYIHPTDPASFSILYTWLLAILILSLGPLDFIPLFINLVAGILLLVAIHRWLRNRQLPRWTQFLILVAVIFLGSLPVLTTAGMEDTMQILAVLLFIYKLSAWLGGDHKAATDKDAPVIPGRIFLYGMLVVTIHYEGILLILIACLLLCARGKWVCAMELFFWPLLPFLCYGLYYLYWDKQFVMFPRGWWPSLIWTSGPGPLVGYVLFLILIVTLVFFRTLRRVPQYGYILLLLSATALAQLFMTGPGWNGAWLIIGAIPVTGVLIARHGRQVFKEDIAAALAEMVRQYKTAGRMALPLLILLLTLPLSWKSGEGMLATTDSCMVMYKQEYQMARFLTSYYDMDNAAVNDVGVTSYLKIGKQFNLVGSAVSDSVLVDSLMWRAGAKIAVISDSLYTHVLVSDWSKVASWHFDDPYSPGSGSKLLFFYGVDSVASDDLKKKLLAFQHTLPPGIAVKYYY